MKLLDDKYIRYTVECISLATIGFLQIESAPLMPIMYGALGANVLVFLFGCMAVTSLYGKLENGSYISPSA